MAPTKLRATLLELLERGARRVPAGHLGADDEHARPTRGAPTIAASVTAMTGGESMRMRSKCSLSECQEVAEALRAEQLRRVRRVVTRRQHPQSGHRGLAHALARLRVADHQVGEPRLLLVSEHLVHARPAHVGVDQQHALAGLRECRSPGCSRP